MTTKGRRTKARDEAVIRVVFTRVIPQRTSIQVIAGSEVEATGLIATMLAEGRANELNLEWTNDPPETPCVITSGPDLHETPDDLRGEGHVGYVTYVEADGSVHVAR